LDRTSRATIRRANAPALEAASTLTITALQLEAAPPFSLFMPRML
jgi:hypothetical protein